MAWTDDRVDTLKKLWAQGLSASQIAKQLGGVTRNAVIGKVHRLGLSGRATPSRPPSRVSSNRPRPAIRPDRSIAAGSEHQKPPRFAVRALTDGVGAGEDFAGVLNLTDHICRWPMGDPAEPGFQFCGRKCKSGSPYCEAHAELAYQPARRRRKKSADADAALDAIAATRRQSW